ncbi:potassium channel family protein [Jiella sonneratiae]|uniref:Two pore domain potassium channel family protein n=1 Tax=Jiella sonneratiae TaxID=2816856 RepID=A0ABS3J1M2_9HYPH|nr:potassium channel family protein [Jiella sonneratiae]MBO0903574.1 two pore domain potassium channel family protein [Jiella sonneratiae]
MPTSPHPARAPRYDAPLARLRSRLRRLYYGDGKAAMRFQTAALTVDLAIIALFIAQPVLKGTQAFLAVDYSVAAVLFIDIAARMLAVPRPFRRLRQPLVLLDVLILVTLLLPYALINFGFLRILRLWSLSKSGRLWQPLKRRGLAEWELPARAVVNLVTFLFLATGFIYTFFFRQSSGLEGYLDALYFTVASVTTTGYGDITLEGPWGKLTAIVVMIIGISLFVQLAQAIFKPSKVHHPCPQCGLQRHDPDAVHCKACGQILNIPNDDG